MKRYLSASLVLILMTFGVPTNSFAATDGCPDTWTIDLNQYPNQELRAAKNKLGINMAEKTETRFIEFIGPQGQMPSISGPLTVNYRNPLTYLYSNSKLETTVKVELKDCPNAVNFTFVYNWLDATKNIFESMTTKSFASKHSNQFSDFKKQQEFDKSIELLTKKIQNDVSRRTRLGMSRIPFGFVDASLQSVANSKEIGITGDLRFFTATLDPECVAGNSQAYALIVGSGICRFAIGVLIPADRSKLSSNPEQINFWYLVETFELDLTSKSTSITCKKGKKTKKVSGTNPKCPKGYKKK